MKKDLKILAFRKGFTLIEVLVVVAIIGILASLLLPVLSSARAKSKQAVCMSQLKQLGIALYNYLDDNDAYFPYTRKVSNNDIVTWDDLISGYDGRDPMTFSEMKLAVITADQDSELYRCPADDIAGHNGNIKRSYAISMLRNNDNIRPGISGGQNQAYEVSRQITAISAPSETILLSENFNKINRIGSHYGSIDGAGHYGIASNNTANSPIPHLQKFNYLFTDGHVAILTYYNTLLGESPITSDARNTMWDAGR
ncbi:prepilin-type N-terminal cleavage/methylation domain-containing protein [Lentisphaera marina]|uniref:prepilin-type N-terminal cleavage/methylation domain-containing protein n=1 Tax=Lentisphaera marina TaxID=1111041 RepID=UPI00236570FF|nr:prepilin-type N-terminal cleavage/methylation domain-containing protein [Lentisphaera marina]MDD7983973.1 prepilin-type N-terminal cleavage/methylation domain-containing protein [Lentisphaera marina]